MPFRLLSHHPRSPSFGSEPGYVKSKKKNRNQKIRNKSPPHTSTKVIHLLRVTLNTLTSHVTHPAAGLRALLGSSVLPIGTQGER
ncbi:hypothetical protein JTE90_006388 [Oedothorax gibbosus]|uniref:Uncharacterized protein n=1 Tax=Oedothorax gibbosus TaxID=931172 RepID=A0AAV6VYA7_9ARAC|nr:hypothetical protein JTE90_006388 [Oedothorax gibbosus]